MIETFEDWWRTHYDHHANNMNDMRDAFEAGQKAEREACAKIADENYELHPQEIADLIRARGKQ